jgi:hypothetical protein
MTFAIISADEVSRGKGGTAAKYYTHQKSGDKCLKQNF